MTEINTPTRAQTMIYVNGVLNGFLFGIGLFIAAVLVKALFHLPLLG